MLGTDCYCVMSFQWHCPAPGAAAPNNDSDDRFRLDSRLRLGTNSSMHRTLPCVCHVDSGRYALFELAESCTARAEVGQVPLVQ